MEDEVGINLVIALPVGPQVCREGRLAVIGDLVGADLDVVQAQVLLEHPLDDLYFGGEGRVQLGDVDLHGLDRLAVLGPRQLRPGLRWIKGQRLDALLHIRVDGIVVCKVSDQWLVQVLSGIQYGA